MYLANNQPNEDIVNALYSDLKNFPPVLLQVGTEEILYEDAILFEKRMKEFDASIILEAYEGMWHVFQTSVGVNMPTAIRAVGKTLQFIEEHRS